MDEIVHMLIKIDRQLGIHGVKLAEIEKKLESHTEDIGFAKKQIFRAQGAVAFISSLAGMLFGSMFKGS